MLLIEYKDVELRRKEFVVFKDVTFSIDSGQPVYLVGKVGSGKSTLLKSLYAEVPVSDKVMLVCLDMIWDNCVVVTSQCCVAAWASFSRIFNC